MSRNGPALEDRIGHLYEMKENVEKNQVEMEERIKKIDNLIKLGEREDKPLDSRVDCMMEAASLIETNLEEEKATDEKLERMKEEAGEELSEEQTIEKKTKDQMSQLYQLLEAFLGGNKIRHIDEDHRMALEKLKGFFTDQGLEL